jgi:hypothetical protein
VLRGLARPKEEAAEIVHLGKLNDGRMGVGVDSNLTDCRFKLARFEAQGHPQRVLPKVSQEMLVEMVGTTRSRVHVSMNKFRKLDFIYNGEIHVNNSLLSVRLHE